MATATQEPLTAVEAQDSCACFESFAKVDAEAGIIRGVKIQGFESNNTGRVIGLPSDKTYSYDRQAIAASKHLYEGAACFIDHPEFQYGSNGERKIPSLDRRIENRFGRFVNVQVRESGVYGDLEYLKTHPLASRVAEAAQRMPEAFACSPVTIADPVKRGDRYVLKVTAVKSVDLIASKPGTTVSLFESNAPQIEEPDMSAEKITALEAEAAKQQEKITALEAEAAKLKALETENAALKADADKAKRREAARLLLESEGVQPTPTLIEAVAAIESEDQRKSLISEWPKVGGSAVKPRSQAQTPPPGGDTKPKITLESSREEVLALIG